MNSSGFCPLSKAYPHMVYQRPKAVESQEKEEQGFSFKERFERIESALYGLEDRISTALGGIATPEPPVYRALESAPTTSSFIRDLFPDERDRNKVGKIITWILIGCLVVIGLVVLEKLQRLLTVSR